MSKNTLNWFDQNNPQREAVAKYRRDETLPRDWIMNDFLDFYKEEITDPYATQDEENEEKRKIQEMKSLIEKFLGYNNKIVEQGEQEMLTRWIEATKP